MMSGGILVLTIFATFWRLIANRDPVPRAKMKETKKRAN